MYEADWIVELQENCWIAPITGDPGRTIVQKHAQRFKTKSSAKAALTRARKYRPFENARIYAITGKSCKRLEHLSSK